MWEKVRNRIAYKLAAIWLALSVPLVLILVASYVQRYESRVELVEQERVGYARLSALAFQSLIGDAQRTMGALGSRASGRVSYLTRQTMGDTARLYPASYLVLVDDGGRVIASSDPELLGNDFSDLAAFDMALRDKDGKGLGPSTKLHGGSAGIHVAQRVYRGGGRPFGVMIMRMDARLLHVRYPFSAATGGISIIDSSGQVVFQNEHAAFAVEQARWGDRYPFVRRALGGKASPTRHFDFPDGTRRIGAFVPVEPYGWAAGSSVDARRALGPFWQDAALTFPLALAVATVGFAISFVTSQRIRKALRRLASEAHRIGEGDFSHPVEVSRTDEIGGMARALEKARQGLVRYDQENQLLFDQQQEVSDLNAALASISGMMHSSLDFDDVLSFVLEAAADALRCEAAGVNLREEGYWVRSALVGLPEHYLGERMTDDQNTIAALAARSKRPVIVNDAARDPRIDEWFAERYGIKSAMVLPLIARGNVFGVIFFNYLSSVHEFSGAELDFASNLSSSLSLAYVNARLYKAEHDVAEKLQSALLDVPQTIEGVDYSVRYESASDIARVGGDFYDLFLRDDGTVGITIGDMSGHGIDAAALTSLVKTAIRVRAAETALSTAQVLTTVNHVLYGHSSTETFATVMFAIFEPSTSRLLYTNGGHTTGVIVSGDDLRRLPANSPLVGALPDPAFSTSETHLRPGEVLFLYTDGLVEARTEAHDLYGEERLFELLLALGAGDPSRLTDVAFNDAHAFSEGNLVDDIAILALRPGEDSTPPSPV